MRIYIVFCFFLSEPEFHFKTCKCICYVHHTGTAQIWNRKKYAGRISPKFPGGIFGLPSFLSNGFWHTFSCGPSGRSAKLTTHLYLVPFKNECTCTSAPNMRTHDFYRDNFNFTFYTRNYPQGIITNILKWHGLCECWYSYSHTDGKASSFAR
jgi:hypothetical protein